MTRACVFAPAAAADLREIASYTIEQWCPAQARTYVQQLEDAAAAVASGHGVFKELSSLQPGLRVATSGKYHIFCLLRSGHLVGSRFVAAGEF